MGCTWLVYQLNEIQTGNGTVAIITTGKTYASGMFQIVNESNSIVCETDLSRSILGGEISDVDFSPEFYNCRLHWNLHHLPCYQDCPTILSFQLQKQTW